jgi:hypothetical protein
LRRKTAFLGALLVIVALLLYFTPSVTTQLAGYLGPTGTDTLFNYNSVVTIPPQDSSPYNASLTTGDSLAVSLTTHPGNIDVILMNQGNFTLWSKGTGVSYQTYAESALNVSTYSFTFTNKEKTQTFYVVLVSHSSTESTEVLLHAIGSRPSQAGILLFPALFGVAGIVVLLIALRGGGPKVEAKVKTPVSTARAAQQPQTQVRSDFCRHCSAALKPGSDFCPSCNKSQL